MDDEPHYWLDDMGQILEYVPMDGPTPLSAREVLRRLNNQRESLKDYQSQILDLERILEGWEADR